MRNGGCLPQPPFLRRLPGGVIGDPQLWHRLHRPVGGAVRAGGIGEIVSLDLPGCAAIMLVTKTGSARPAEHEAGNEVTDRTITAQYNSRACELMSRCSGPTLH